MTLGQNIARLRAQKNLSQGDLADALEVSRQSVSKWETDASIPELDKLLRLAELFGVTLDELVKGENAQPEAARGEAPDKESAGAYTAAAPAASPERFRATAIAALEIGSVSIMPMIVETTAPIGPGCSSVARIISRPSAVIIALTGGPISFAAAMPVMIVTAGVAIMSITVSFETILPHSVPIIAATKAPTGPPQVFPAKPTAAQEKTTICGALSAWAIATAIAGPTICPARVPNSTNIGIPHFEPTVFNMRPVIREAKRPMPIAPSASTK